MTAIESGSNVNLEELRCQLAGHMALILIGVSGLLMWRVLSQEPFPIILFGLLAVLLGVGWRVRVLVSKQSVLARHLLVWGLTAGLLVAMGLFSDPWLPFLGLIRILFKR